MSPRELDRLEQDVAQARKRLIDDIERLRSRDTLSGFKDDILAQASDIKDEWMRKAETAARSALERAAMDLKQRASAHPAAALAVAAGVSWHLARRPPIGALLVGLGLVGLFRSSKSKNGAGAAEIAAQAADALRSGSAKLAERASEAAQAAGAAAGQVAEDAAEQVGAARQGLNAAARSGAAAVAERAAQAQQAARAAAGQIAESASEHVSSAQRKLNAWTADAARSASHARSQANDVAKSAASRARNALPEGTSRNAVLLGAAAVAVGGAAAMAIARRPSASPRRRNRR